MDPDDVPLLGEFAMKQNVSNGVGIAIVVVVVLAVLFFGWRYVQKTGGGPDSGASQAVIDHYKQVAAQADKAKAAGGQATTGGLQH